MEKIIYFNNEDGKEDRCTGSVYCNLLDYAFSETEFFMLVYVNYYGKGYTKIMKDFLKQLKPFKVKSRTNPYWPGTLGTYCPNTTYKVVFYRNELEAKEILKKVSCLSEWSCPLYPQDLAFFKGNKCWLYSVGHEMIAGIINPTEGDLDFVETNGLALRTEVITSGDNYFVEYDEVLVN